MIYGRVCVCVYYLHCWATVKIKQDEVYSIASKITVGLSGSGGLLYNNIKSGRRIVLFLNM